MRITIEPTYKQHLAWQILEDKETEEFLFGGGAGGGKSWLGCEWLISMCLRYPNTKYFIARKRLKVLKQTTLITFFKVCRKRGLKPDIHYRYREQQSIIEFIQTGSIIDLLEIDYKPSDPDYEDLGSYEYTSGWIEEAGEIVFEAFDTLKIRVNRQLNDKYGILGKILLTCNPKKNWLYKEFYKLWRENKLPKNRKFLQSLVDDNPRNEKGYKQKLLSIKNKSKKERLLFGKWEYEDDPATLIEFDAIADLFTNTIYKSGYRYITADIARFGDDLTVIYCWEDLEIYKVYIRRKQGINITTQLLRDVMANERIPFSHTVIDEDGVGGGVVDNLVGVKGFIANSSPLEDIRINQKTEEVPNYRNLKAQCAYMLADEINNRRIAISQEVIIDYDESINFEELLTEDLEQIKAKDIDADDKKLDLIPKEEIRGILGRSPDFSDAMVMRMLFLLKLSKIQSNVVSSYLPKLREYKGNLSQKISSLPKDIVERKMGEGTIKPL